MPDLGSYAVPVLGAYAITVIFIALLVLASLKRSRNIRRILERIESGDADKNG